ncbi:MAG: C4-type zinc ribbon domain-containing protein [candidate division WOR-3 bacterium]
MEFPEKVKILIELYEKDKEIDELKSLEREVPKKIEEMDNELKGYKENLEKEEKKLALIDTKRRELEKIVEEYRLNLENFNKRKKEIHTNEEFILLKKEIEKTEETITQKEDELLEVYFEKEDQKKKVDEAKKALEERKKEIEKVKEKLLQDLKSSREELVLKEDERERIAARLQDENLLRKYIRIKSSRGTGLAIIENPECTECHSTIPPQLFVEIRKIDKIISCPSCGRILIYKWVD